MELAPGDTLVLYTDGITEAVNPQQEMFGDERLLQCLGCEQEQSASQTVTGLLEKVRSYISGAPQSDDITLIAVRCASTQ